MEENRRGAVKACEVSAPPAAAAQVAAAVPAARAAGAHESLDHGASPVHHHHSHAADSRHAHGHHLLTVEDLSVSFRMYDEYAEEAEAVSAEGEGGVPGLSGVRSGHGARLRPHPRPYGRLRRYVGAPQREVEVIHGLSLSVHEGEIVAVVGASGSGKTLLADAVLGLFEPNALVRGRIWFDGAPMDAASLAAERGSGIALVPQSVASLDPLMRVGRQVEGTPRGRGAVRRADAARRRARRRELFARYGLSEDVARLYPHELSGGMARRVLLCCALMESPRLIVADEPTPGLDLPLAQAAMADFRAFADAEGGVLLITHDIELALTVADRVAVFRDGTVVEETAVASFASPDTLAHPFSRQLWHALPEHGFAVTEGEGAAGLPAEAGNASERAAEGAAGLCVEGGSLC
ncbi:ATP-binding cassette domain-containing protein [Adlercreutzia wanghongyangiae]|uniref:ATP-binding cassette domain-containing protein n=1 Tax=Adlercreutzia wanghongyangiae TaxID=3111451 RepID=UPI00374285D4